MKNKKRKLSLKLFRVITVASFMILLINFLFPLNLKAEERSLEELKRKSEKYKQLINLKQQQQMTLENQLQLMDIQIDNYDNNIALLKRDVRQNEGEIGKIKNIVIEQEKNIEKSKIELKSIINLYYQIEQESVFHFLSKNGFSQALNYSEYLGQTSGKINKQIKEIKEKKAKLEEKKKAFENKRNELKKKNDTLKEKIYYLNNEKNSKQTLLVKTKGEENRYQELLSRIEVQKRALIGGNDTFSSENKEKIRNILASQPKPKNGLASVSWYYAQDDDRWGYKHIGLSSSLMKDYGCAVSSLAMTFTYHKIKITPGALASEPIFYQDLIVWPDEFKGKIKLKSSRAHGGVDWAKVDKELTKKNPVIVFVRARSGAGHYVVIHHKDKRGKYVVHDPLFGPNLYLETTQRLVGALYNTNTTIDQLLIYK